MARSLPPAMTCLPDTLFSLRRRRHLIAAIEHELPGLVVSMVDHVGIHLLIEAALHGSTLTLERFAAELAPFGDGRMLVRNLARRGAIRMEADAGGLLLRLDPDLAARLMQAASHADPARAPAQPYIRGRVHSIDEISDHSETLAALHRAWAQDSAGGLAVYDDSILERSRRIAGPETVHLIDVTADGAAGYFWSVLGAYADPVRKFWPSGTCLGALASPSFRSFMADTFQSTKHQAAPRLEDIVGRTDDALDIAYCRLILPYSRNGRSVDLLLIGIHPGDLDPAPATGRDDER